MRTMRKQSDPVMISVIVPVYNVEKYIGRCARSLFGQTMREGIEFIFVDDCSPDNSIEVLENVLAEYPYRKEQTVILRHSRNRGVTEARDTGVKTARGEYIAFCDSDDWVELDAYRMITEKAVGEDLDMVIINIYFQLSTKKWMLRFTEKKSRQINETTAMDFQIRNVLINGIGQKIIRRAVWQAAHVMMPASNMGEDLVLSVQLIHCCKKIGCIGVPLYHYYYNNQSASRKPSEKAVIKRYQDYKANIDVVIEFLRENGLYEKYKYDMSLYKLGCRHMLLPYLDKSNYSLWRSTYPELDLREYWSRFSGKDMFKYLLVRCRLYGLLPLFRAIYRRLGSYKKHMRR